MGSEPQNTSARPSYAASASPRPRKFSWLWLIALVVLIAGLAWYVSARKDKGGEHGGMPHGRPAVTVGVATANAESFPVELDALGTVTPVATSVVRAQVAGVVQQVLFTEGQAVQRGQLLAVIDPRPFENALMQVKGQLQRDEAQLDNARVTERRYRQLQAQDSIAQQDVDAQVALVRQLEGTVNVDRAAVRSAQLNLDFSRITAPISGRIGLRSVDAGNLVGPSDQNGLVTITQQAPIDVMFSVPQDAVPEMKAALKNGKPLQVTAFDRARSTPLAGGRFLALDNLVDTQTGTVRAKARFDNANGGLFPNQFVNVRLKLRAIDGAIAVPVSAVRNGGSGPFVYVLNAGDSTVSLRQVKRGLSSADKTQILAGVQAGEQVITDGADRLTDGAKVRLPGQRGKGEGKGDGKGENQTAPGEPKPRRKG
jgi:multidrug efflux system membrane fusion protein